MKLMNKTFFRRKYTPIVRRGREAQWTMLLGFKMDNKLGRKDGFFMTVPAIPYERFVLKRLEEIDN